MTQDMAQVIEIFKDVLLMVCTEGNSNCFGRGSVPVATAAKIFGKDACWVRAGIIVGWLPIGYAVRDGKLVTKIEEMDSRLSRINFYISPKKLWEITGYVWKGERIS